VRGQGSPTYKISPCFLKGQKGGGGHGTLILKKRGGASPEERTSTEQTLENRTSLWRKGKSKEWSLKIERQQELITSTKKGPNKDIWNLTDWITSLAGQKHRRGDTYPFPSVAFWVSFSRVEWSLKLFSYGWGGSSWKYLSTIRG